MSEWRNLNGEASSAFPGAINKPIAPGLQNPKSMFFGFPAWINILLKFAESIIPFLKAQLKNYANQRLINKLRAGFVRTPLRESLKTANYELQGGLPLLGVNGISIVGHGSSTPLAIKNMVLRAKEMHDKKLIDKLRIEIEQYSNTQNN